MFQLRLPLPAGEFDAYLFDFDGTIADSMPLRYLAWRYALAEWNCEFPEKLFYDWGGYPATQIVALLNEKHGLQMRAELVMQKTEKFYLGSLSNLKAIPEVLEHIEMSHGRIPLAVVSGGTRNTIEASLDALGLLGKFKVFVCAGDYQKAKPDPEPFLVAAARLGVRPESCLVFEDAELGMEAARAAGMAAVKVPQPWQRNLGEA
ncbi:MAG TPA: HAD family phosphatase [Dongiaceae bacterium]|nr:HAD family phosphatase [Dongiaceae bacterium]